MAISQLQLNHVHTDAGFEVFLLVQELDRIVDVAKKHFELEQGTLHPDINEYVCNTCMDESDYLLYHGDSSMWSPSPIWCAICDVKLEYEILAAHANLNINYLKTIVKAGTPLMKEQWYDLRAAVENLYLADPIWPDVEYIVYRGSAIDPELSAS